MVRSGALGKEADRQEGIGLHGQEADRSSMGLKRKGRSGSERSGKQAQAWKAAAGNRSATVRTG